MPNEEIMLSTNPPLGNLGLIPLESCRELGEKVDQYLVKWRSERDDEALVNHHTKSNYKSDSYIVKIAVPRFGSGEAKGTILQSVRGLDVFLIVDVTNYSLTYSLCGHENHILYVDRLTTCLRMITMQI